VRCHLQMIHKDCEAYFDESFDAVGDVFGQFSPGDRTFRTFEVHRRNLPGPSTVPGPLKT
jgi:hypothetical protein